jgi:hypothetical protein
MKIKILWTLPFPLVKCQKYLRHIQILKKVMILNSNKLMISNSNKVMILIITKKNPIGKLLNEIGFLGKFLLRN